MGEQKLYDNHGRLINYLRLAVTDRCNLRCYYCMPEEGIKYVPRLNLLSYEEMLRLVTILSNLGIEKIRITGGEPFVRKDMMKFLRSLKEIEGIKQIHLTTNGTLTAPIIPELKQLGIKSINLSLDSLDRDRFREITRRDELNKVLETFELLLKHDIPTKINAVIMNGVNTQDIIPMAHLTKDDPVSVRFIEEMPFNGEGKREGESLNFLGILKILKEQYPEIEKIPDPPFSTSMNYRIPGYRGTVGIIPAFSRTFCGTCNRIRITPKGMLKTCLYDDGVFNIKDLMRAGASDAELETAFLDALSHRAKDGFEAEAQRRLGIPINESMSTIGG